MSDKLAGGDRVSGHRGLGKRIATSDHSGSSSSNSNRNAQRFGSRGREQLSQPSLPLEVLGTVDGDTRPGALRGATRSSSLSSLLRPVSGKTGPLPSIDESLVHDLVGNAMAEAVHNLYVENSQYTNHESRRQSVADRPENASSAAVGTGLQDVHGHGIARKGMRKPSIAEVKQIRRSSSQIILLPQAKLADMKRFLIQSEDMRRAKDSEMKRYFDKHNLASVFEAILSYIIVMQPPDHKKTFLALLYRLRGFQGLITWDMFIPPDKCPPRRVLPYWMLRGDDDEDNPTPEMYQVARAYNSTRVLGPTFRAWIAWYKNRQRLIKQLMERLEMAQQHAHKVLLKRCLKPLVEHRLANMERRKVVLDRMNQMRKDNLMLTMFRAWKKYTEHARLASLYFEEISRSHNKESDTLAQDSDLFSSLPYPIRVKIFSYLGLLDRMQCLGVCRTWREVAQAAVLWNAVYFSELKTMCKDTAISYVISKYQPFICKINLRGCTNVTNYGFSQLGQCSNLQDLNLSECIVLRDAALRVIVEGCPSLMYLNLSSCSITDLSLKYLSQYCENICYLSLACCPNVSPLGCQYLTEGMGCSNLYWLDVSSCPQITSEGLSLIASKCRSLTTLLLNDLINITDEGILAVCRNCPGLAKLTIRACYALTDETLRHLGEHSRNLRHLEISENRHFTADGFKMLSSQKAALRLLVIEQCPRLRDTVMVHICKHPLHHLDMSHCNGITDSGIKQLGLGKARDHLQFLRLSGFNKVTDTGLRALSRAVGKVRHLDLSYCANVTDASLEAIISGCEALKELNLRGCHQVGDKLVQAFRDYGLDTVEWLDVSESDLLSDIGLEALAQACPSLQHLSVAGCSGISDKGFRELAFGCKELSWLSLAYCEQLSDVCLVPLAQAGKNLSALHLYGIRNISNNAVEKLFQHIAGLKKLSLISSCRVSHAMVNKLRETNAGAKIHYDMEEPIFESQLPVRTLYEPDLTRNPVY